MIGICSIPRGKNSLRYAAAAIFCVVASSASSDEVAVHRALAQKPPLKAAAKKPEPSCEAPVGPETRSASKRNTQTSKLSCLVSLSGLDRLRAKKDFSLVDVRSAADYDRYRIADSINIPLHLVKTKEFLKKRSVVLVNEGRSTAELEKKCVELKQAGFERLSVLEGGLFAWHASNRALEGDAVAQSKLNLVSAEELFEERNMPNWSVIDVSTPGTNKDIRRWLPAKSTAIPIKSKGDAIGRISSTISKQRKQRPAGRLILIADDNEAYERIDAKLKKSGVTASLLRLDGGVKGYREHVTKQLAIWAEQKKPRSYQACRG